MTAPSSKEKFETAENGFIELSDEELRTLNPLEDDIKAVVLADAPRAVVQKRAL